MTKLDFFILAVTIDAIWLSWVFMFIRLQYRYRQNTGITTPVLDWWERWKHVSCMIMFVAAFALICAIVPD